MAGAVAGVLALGCASAVVFDVTDGDGPLGPSARSLAVDACEEWDRTYHDEERPDGDFHPAGLDEATNLARQASQADVGYADLSQAFDDYLQAVEDLETIKRLREGGETDTLAATLAVAQDAMDANIAMARECKAVGVTIVTDDGSEIAY